MIVNIFFYEFRNLYTQWLNLNMKSKLLNLEYLRYFLQSKSNNKEYSRTSLYFGGEQRGSTRVREKLKKWREEVNEIY